jgi:hypothetical protein
MSIQISDRSVTRTIKDLTEDFYVRTALNSDWAYQLAELIESGVEPDPIYITRDGKVIDGRHRLQAHSAANRTEIRCKIVEADNDIELIAFALKCNMGGSMPPSKADFEHVIRELLNRGTPKKQLADTLPMLPNSLVRKYLKEVESRMNRAQLAKAATAVAEGGLNVPTASIQYNVDEKDLKAILSSTSKRKSKNGIEELERAFSNRFRSNGTRTAASLRKILDMYQDGDVTHKQVLKMFNHLEHLIKRETRAIAGWRKRFDALEAPKKIA